VLAPAGEPTGKPRGHGNRWAKPEEEVTAAQIIAGLHQTTVRAHSAGIKLIGATLTPFSNDSFVSHRISASQARH
jgi:hypothetical protein